MGLIIVQYAVKDLEPQVNAIDICQKKTIDDVIFLQKLIHNYFKLFNNNLYL